MSEEQQHGFLVGTVQVEQLTVDDLDDPCGQRVHQVLPQLKQLLLIYLALRTILPG